MAERTVEVELPAQTTLDQAIVALLQPRRGEVPGDAILDQPAVLTFRYTTSEKTERTTPAASTQEITPEE